jgi:aminocarboxymuconate-semialdehyde decarboxylase
MSEAPRLVDYQSHWYPESYFLSILDRKAYPRAERHPDGGYLLEMKPGGFRAHFPQHFVDLDLQLADNDKHGVDVMVTNPSIVGEVGELELSAAREAIDHLNEAGAQAQKEHAGRVIATAMLPVQDIEASIETVDRAVELGLRAICMVSNIAGRPLATKETLPLYQHIEKAGMPIILHPANHSLAAPSGIDPVGELGVGWMFDTTAAALSLISSGTLDACPDLRVLHPHLGGVVPFIDGRLEVVLPMWGIEQVEHDMTWYLRNSFYVDSVSQTPGSLQLAIDCYGVDRILFGSDYPWMPLPIARPYVENNAGKEDAQAILFNNQLPFVIDALNALSA